MAKGSTYIRGLCIVLNILLGISGVILLLFGIVANSVTAGHVENWTHFELLSVGFGLATILLSGLGIYGAYREHVLALLLYSIFMAIEFIVLIVLAIMKTLAQPKEEKDIEQSFGNMIPLEREDEEFQRELNKLQQQDKCCGLRDYTDWRVNIPPSCFCATDYPDQETKCVSVLKPRNVESIRHPDSVPDPFLEAEYYVYNTGCGQIVIEYVKNHTRILLGIIFTLATVKVAAMIVALLLCYKIYKRSPATGLSKANNSRTKYELQPDKAP